MVRVDFMISSTGLLKGFKITGHSGYAEEGSDIVCAAISSVAYMAANTITQIICADAVVDADDGDMYLLISKKDMATCQTVLEGLKLHFLSLEEQYPENLNVFYLEV